MQPSLPQRQPLQRPLVTLVAVLLTLSGCASLDEDPITINVEESGAEQDGTEEASTTTATEGTSDDADAQPLNTTTSIVEPADTVDSTTATGSDETTGSSETTVRSDLATSDELAAPGHRSTWAGTIDGDIGYTLWLAQDGDRLRGEITYDAVGTPITVLGERYQSGDGYYLTEFGPDGRVSGDVTLLGVTNGRISSAMWRDLPMTIAATGSEDYRLETSVRPGRYRYAYPPFGAEDPESDPGTCCGPQGAMTLADVTEDSVTISFNNVGVGPGFHLAILDPVVVPLVGNQATYDATGDFVDCLIEIVVYDGVAFVNQSIDRNQCGFGANAYVGGNYVLVDS